MRNLKKKKKLLTYNKIFIFLIFFFFFFFKKKVAVSSENFFMCDVIEVPDEKLRNYLKSIHFFSCSEIKKMANQFHITNNPNFKKGGVIVFCCGKVLLVQGKHSYLWGFPKGNVEPFDLNLVHTSFRELFEETGLFISDNVLQNSKRIKKMHYHETQYFVLITENLCCCKHSLKPSANEVHKMKWFSIHDESKPDPRTNDLNIFFHQFEKRSLEDFYANCDHLFTKREVQHFQTTRQTRSQGYLSREPVWRIRVVSFQTETNK